MTLRLYLEDAYLREFDARVVASADGWWALSHSAFYPGGGGQPQDRGELVVEDRPLTVTAVREDEDGRRLWHHVGRDAAAGTAVRGMLDWPYRYALMRHHALMHVVNTVAQRHFDGLITGVQLGPDRSRIDLRLRAGFDAAAELEARVNDALAAPRGIAATVIPEAEYQARPDLIRTLNVRPPIVNGQVRVVTIDGFDAQACGGTHPHDTAEIGRAHIVKRENKGRDNKRFYWTLAP
ncbi:MAG TPA: alanyl-tRNA editing protein [Methylomirabilota bacterium]|nr:alanyl-tRNA editing protein [Methylomirabilota bacterium]